MTRFWAWCAVFALWSLASAQPKLLLILVHQPLTPDSFSGSVPFQTAWVVWERGAAEPLALATGRRIAARSLPATPLKFASAANTARQRHRLMLAPEAYTSGFTAGTVSTLAARLEAAGKRALYLHTPQSPNPTAYALIALGASGAEARTYPSLEAMRLDFFRLQADWAVLELKQWDYQALELLLAEGVEVWVVSISSPEALTFERTRLSAAARYAAREPKGLLTSPSTRWNGLIREVDLAPTLHRAIAGVHDSSSWSGAPAFEMRQFDWHRFWNGWLARAILQETTQPIGVTIRGDALQRIANWGQANQHVAPVVRRVVIALVAIWLIGGVVLWQRHRLRGVVRRVFVAGLSVFCLTPAVAILYAYYPFHLWGENQAEVVATLAGWLTLWWSLLSLVAFGLARWGQMPLLCAASLVTLGTLTADLLVAGGYGVNRSLLSAGVNDPEQLFGVNEWFWGFALATGVLAPASWLESRGRARFEARGRIALGMAYGCLMALCGLPLLGAALDAWLPMSLAFGTGIGLFTGVLPAHAAARPMFRAVLTLLPMGMLLVALAIAIDAQQPWQRQIGWARDWLHALIGQPSFEAVVALASLCGITGYSMRSSLHQFVQRAYTLRSGCLICVVAGAVALLLGKVVAAGVIALLCVMFVLEYLVGGKDWGYAYTGNGVAH
ncbi:MAG: hypothetical protein NZ874_05005 [Fimbriimonadales bacterium]|nr:hypothetical protein [Fimbriimonadales bacterium]